MRHIIILAAFLTSLIPAVSMAEYNPIKSISNNSLGRPANELSDLAGISAEADGRFIVFQSKASDLVSNDTNNLTDVFLVDRLDPENPVTERISIASNGTQANGDSFSASVSADGNLVVFASDATNLVSGDTNTATDIFLRNRTEETTTRISVRSDAFQSNGRSISPKISADGTKVVYQSLATNLVAGDTNNTWDVFVYDIATAATTRISIKSDGTQANGASGSPDISDDGNLVVFDSEALNLVDNDFNGFTDIFLRDIAANTTTIVSRAAGNVATNGSSSNPVISGDGTFIAYQSLASNLAANDNNNLQDIFLYEIATTTNTLVSFGRNNQGANGISLNPKINVDGRYVIFESLANNLVQFDTNDKKDLFAFDRTEQKIVRISVTNTGRQFIGESYNPSINDTGQFIVFSSAEHIGPTINDNKVTDIYLVDTQCLLKPIGVVPQDQDEDGTNDCDDECPLDPAKTEAGVCGCGVADVDTDGDGTLDCNDGCPEDSLKVEPGICGCGFVEDANNNGIPDCLEPTTSTRPPAPTLTYRKKRDRLVVFMQSEFIGSRHQIQIHREKGSLLMTRRSRRSTARIPLMGIKGQLNVRYRFIISRGKFSKFSRFRRINIR